MDFNLGWLGNLFGGGGDASSPGAPTDLTAPGQTAPTPDSAGMPVNGSPPTDWGKTLGTMGQGAGAMQKGLAQAQAGGGGGGSSIPPPRPQPNPYATALAQVMAGLNAKNKIGNTTPGGTQ